MTTTEHNHFDRVFPRLTRAVRKAKKLAKSPAALRALLPRPGSTWDLLCESFLVLEFEWIRQYWWHGATHHKLQRGLAYWPERVAQLEKAWAQLLALFRDVATLTASRPQSKLAAAFASLQADVAREREAWRARFAAVDAKVTAGEWTGVDLPIDWRRCPVAHGASSLVGATD